METKYRLYKMYAEEEVDISELQKGLGKILQSEDYLSPEKAISEQIGAEIDSDNYGIVYSNKKMIKNKISLFKTKREVELEAVIMGNDKQLKIVKDYLIAKGIILSFSTDVKSATLTIYNSDISGTKLNLLISYLEKIDTKWRKNKVNNGSRYESNRTIHGEIKKILSVYNNLRNDFGGIKFDKLNISFEF